MTAVWTCLMVWSFTASVWAANDEERLMQDLFWKYNPVARPVRNSSTSSTVSMSFILLKLHDLNIKTETLVTSGYLRVRWTDERLSWEPSSYNGIENVVVSPLMVWLPDFVLYNSIGQVVYTEEHYTLIRVSVRYDGHISWTPGGEFRSQCASNVQYFPFDKQQCSLVFGNWAYSSAAINLTYRSCAHQELLSRYAQNGEWDIVRTEITHIDRYYNECCGCTDDPFPEVQFTLHFQRKSLYYIANIVVPSLILTALVLMVLWLPPDSGEKMSMGVTLLLSYTVFIIAVSESVPHTSEAIPIILIYISAFMGITCLTVTSSVFVLILHHNHVSARPPSCLVHLAWLLNKRAMVSIGLKQNGTRVVPFHDDLTPRDSVRKLREIQTTNNRVAGKEMCSVVTDDLQTTLSGILCEVQYQTDRHRRADLRKEILIEWRVVAMALDRLIFWIILLLFFITSIVTLVILPETGQ